MPSIGHTLAHLFHPRRSNNHRPRLLHPEALAFMILIVLTFYAATSKFQVITQNSGTILGYASNISAGQVVEQTNSQRASVGLSPLSMNDQLSNAAAGKAQDMFQNQYWAHTSPSGMEPWDFMKGAGYRYKVAGENLARDFMTTPEMVGAWMASPTHKANIVNPRFTQIGVAVVNGVLHGTETTLVVQMFGLPNTGTSPTPEVTEQAKTIESPEDDVQTQVAPTEPPQVETTTPVALNQAAPEDEIIDIEPVVTEPITGNAPNVGNQPVLSRFLVTGGTLLPTILISPLQLLKAFFLAVIILLMVVLIYDMLVIGYRQQMRLVGKNLAHILLFFAVAFLLIFFKGGMIG